MNGIFNLLKPPGISSFQALAKVKSLMGVKKVGHSGTLDPMALGVLPLLIGKATRIASLMLAEDKDYFCEIRLGQQSSTDDAQGEMISYSNKRVSDLETQKAIFSFLGPLAQIPPQYSAVKVQGKRAYLKARLQEDFTLKPRHCLIRKIVIHKIDYPVVRLFVSCTKGTYIRSLARDLGAKLAVGGHLSYLVRVRSGDFHLKDSVPLTNFNPKVFKKNLLTMDQGLLRFPALNLNAVEKKKIVSGLTIVNQQLADQKMLRLYHLGEFIALGQVKDEIIKPFKVFV